MIIEPLLFWLLGGGWQASAVGVCGHLGPSKNHQSAGSCESAHAAVMSSALRVTCGASCAVVGGRSVQNSRVIGEDRAV